MAVILEYDQLLTRNDAYKVQPNIGAGVEIGTATHAFQVFIAPYNQIIDQQNLVYNTNKISDGEVRIGFNLTVRF